MHGTHTSHQRGRQADLACLTLALLSGACVYVCVVWLCGGVGDSPGVGRGGGEEQK